MRSVRRCPFCFFNLSEHQHHSHLIAPPHSTISPCQFAAATTAVTVAAFAIIAAHNVVEAFWTRLPLAGTH